MLEPTQYTLLLTEQIMKEKSSVCMGTAYSIMCRNRAAIQCCKSSVNFHAARPSPSGRLPAQRQVLFVLPPWLHLRLSPLPKTCHNRYTSDVICLQCLHTCKCHNVAAYYSLIAARAVPAVCSLYQLTIHHVAF